jgi:hypothetical protein
MLTLRTYAWAGVALLAGLATAGTSHAQYTHQPQHLGKKTLPVFDKHYIKHYKFPTVNPGSCFGYYPTKWTRWEDACPPGMNCGGEIQTLPAGELPAQGLPLPAPQPLQPMAPEAPKGTTPPETAPAPTPAVPAKPEVKPEPPAPASPLKLPVPEVPAPAPKPVPPAPVPDKPAQTLPPTATSITLPEITLPQVKVEFPSAQPIQPVLLPPSGSQ